MTVPTRPTAAAESRRVDLRDRRVLLGIGGVVLVLAAAVWFLLLPALRGSSSATSYDVPTRAHALATATATPTASAAKAPVVTANVGRDPFSPLYVPAVAASGAAASAATGATGTTGSTGSTGTAPTATSPTPVPAPTMTAVPAPQLVDVLAVSAGGATVTVNSLQYVVHTDVEFADGLIVTAVAVDAHRTAATTGTAADTSTVTMQQSSGAPVTLRIGASHTFA